jgi:hypothetical protein
VFTQGEPVIVAGDQPDEHYGFSAVFEQAVKCFECLFAIACEQVIAQLKIRQLAGTAD